MSILQAVCGQCQSMMERQSQYVGLTLTNQRGKNKFYNLVYFFF